LTSANFGHSSKATRPVSTDLSNAFAIFKTAVQSDAAIVFYAGLFHLSFYRTMTIESATPPRLIIKKLVLENFKSYAGRVEIGPFEKV
jgi:hypothetical protein